MQESLFLRSGSVPLLMKQYITLLLITFFCRLYVYGQVEITHVGYLDNDSLVTSQLLHFSFDTTGYYKAIYKSDSFYFTQSPKGRSIYTDYDEIRTKNDIVYVLSDSTGQYYMPRNWASAYGPLHGQVTLTPNKQSSMFAISVAYTDLIRLFVHDSLVGQVKGKKLAYDFEYDNWCALSDTGVTIYYTYSKKKYRLFIDHKLIDSSEKAFKSMAVNDKGQYSYIKYDKKAVYLKTSDTTLGPFDTTAYDRISYYCGVQNDGSYYYELPGEVRNVWVINSRILYGQLDYLKFTGNGHYMYFYKEDTGVQSRQRLDMKNFDRSIWGQRPLNNNEIKLINHSYKLNLDGKTIELPYNKIEAPVIDSTGNYAFCGIRDFMMYRVVNGTELPRPLSQHGVRPKALYMGVKGDTYHVFTTLDSSYLYHNNKLLYAAPKGYECSSFLRKKLQQKPGKLKLYSGQIEYQGEMFRDNDDVKFSSWFAMGSESEYYVDPITGMDIRQVQTTADNQILKSGEMNGRSYYIITGKDGCYRVFVDFSLAAVLKKDDIDCIDPVVSDQVYLDEKQLIFYSRRKGKICRYKVTL